MLGVNMGKKLSPEQNELYKRTDEVLHYIWDPIGVSDSPCARDEYWGYLPQVFAKLLKNEPSEKIVEYLLLIETENMGLSKNEKNAERTVEILEEYREKILAKDP
jgi:hypothetical protein